MGQAHPGEAIYGEVRLMRRGRRARAADLGIGIAAVAAVVAVGALSWWYRYGAHAPGQPMTFEVPGDEVAVPQIDPPPPAIRYPIQAAISDVPPPARWDEALSQGFAALVGPAPLPWSMPGDALARRLVATIDSLDRVHSPSRMWPAAAAPGRFLVARDGEESTIAPDNARRYAGFVQLVERVDPHRAVALYVRLYPLFQRAYEDLGYPGRYFNDRLVDTLDHLLAAPEPQEPIAVRRVDVRGPMELEQPWRHHDFVDPSLQTLSAGQKLMVRVGPDNERRLKARLAVWREALVGRAPEGAARGP
jgi:hypothetical protein